MKKWAALAVVAVLAVALTVGSAVVLVGATITISRMANPLLRAIATMAELLIGTLWLIGTVYITTHLAVVIFAKDSLSRRSASS